MTSSLSFIISCNIHLNYNITIYICAKITLCACGNQSELQALSQHALMPNSDPPACVHGWKTISSLPIREEAIRERIGEQRARSGIGVGRSRTLGAWPAGGARGPMGGELRPSVHKDNKTIRYKELRRHSHNDLSGDSLCWSENPTESSPTHKSPLR